MTRFAKLTILVIRLFSVIFTVCRATFGAATCKNSHQKENDKESERCDLFHVTTLNF
jgi:hypothetical protein